MNANAAAPGRPPMGAPRGDVPLAGGGTRRRVAAIIVHHGPREDCLGCLASLEASRGVEVVPFVVDHNPRGDGEIERRVLERRGRYSLQPNRGFAAGCNAGMAAARARGSHAAYLLLNPDARLGRFCIARLLDVLDARSEAGLLGPGILQRARPSFWWCVGADIEWPSARPRSRLHGLPRSSRPRGVERAGFLPGSVLLVRPEAFDRLGPMDEGYFLYFEDADYAFRARAAGLDVLVVPSALAWHVGGRSMPSPAFQCHHQIRSRLRFSRRWSPRRGRGVLERARLRATAVLRAALRPWRWGDAGAFLPALAVLDDLLRRPADLREAGPGSLHPPG